MRSLVGKDYSWLFCVGLERSTCKVCRLAGWPIELLWLLKEEVRESEKVLLAEVVIFLEILSQETDAIFVLTQPLIFLPNIA